MSLCSLANSTTLTKKSCSTHIVVGLCGKDRMSILALGQDRRAASWRRGEKAPPRPPGEGGRAPAAVAPGERGVGEVGVGPPTPAPRRGAGRGRGGKASLGPPG